MFMIETTKKLKSKRTVGQVGWGVHFRPGGLRRSVFLGDVGAVTCRLGRTQTREETSGSGIPCAKALGQDGLDRFRSSKWPVGWARLRRAVKEEVGEEGRPDHMGPWETFLVS